MSSQVIHSFITSQNFAYPFYMRSATEQASFFLFFNWKRTIWASCAQLRFSFLMRRVTGGKQPNDWGQYLYISHGSVFECWFCKQVKCWQKTLLSLISFSLCSNKLSLIKRNLNVYFHSNNYCRSNFQVQYSLMCPCKEWCNTILLLFTVIYFLFVIIKLTQYTGQKPLQIESY